MQYLWFVMACVGCGGNDPVVDANLGKPNLTLMIVQGPVIAGSTVDVEIGATGIPDQRVYYRLSSPVGGFAPASPDDSFVIDPTGSGAQIVSWTAPVAPQSTNIAVEASYDPQFANGANEITNVVVVAP